MSVESNENKALLMQILNNHPLKISNPGRFTHILNTETHKIHNNRFSYNNNLINMNKDIIRKFQSMIQEEPVKTNVVPNRQENSVPKIKIFETRLKEQQNNFNSMIKAEVPKEIDFSDKPDDDLEITSSTVDLTMQKRHTELQKIMTGYQKDKKAEEWIKGDNIKPVNNKEGSPSIINNKINSPTKKRVSFEVSEKIPESTTLLHKLKMKPIESPNNNRDYSDYFKQIITNQELILQRLSDNKI